MKLLSKSFYLLVLLGLVFAPVFVRAQDAAEDEDVVVNEESATGEEAQQAEEESLESLSSPFAKTHVLFVKPEGTTDLPGGRLARLLVSFQNNGSTAFLVENLEGSFRFPQDFSYVIQNFTAFEFNKVVESERESTFEYMFTPSEAFSQRQLGLTINLRYRGQDGKSFINTVFNETVTIVDFEEGFDGETFFLYVFLAAIVVLLVLGANQLFSSKKNKISRLVGGSGSSSAQRQQQQANGSTGDVDLDWIPSTHLSTNNKSPRTSPRQRNARKSGGVSGNSSNDEQ